MTNRIARNTFLLVTIAWLGCADGESSDLVGDDGSLGVHDASAGLHDAGLGTTDGASGTRDAAPWSSDATPGLVDAAPLPPDAAPRPLIGLPYPELDAYEFKGLQPDYWANYDQISGKLGKVSINLLWKNWEPSIKSPPCGGNEQEYAGRCYTIDYGASNAIKEWTRRGVVVTGILYGVPAWARTGNTNCTPLQAGFEMFCAPDNPAEFGRYAGMLAHRFNGLNGHGRVADFAIHNEVNHNVWFDIGCGNGTPCDFNTWIDRYSANYTVAYDLIKSEQSEAKVLIPFTTHFDTAHDRPNETFPYMSVKTFLARFSSNVGTREWKIAYHSYAKDLFTSVFGVKDLPSVTYGN